MISTGAATIGVAEESKSAKMKSVLEMDDLSDFLVQAQLANKDFVSEREQFLNIEDAATEYVPTGRVTTAAVIRDDERSSAGGDNGVREEFSFHELSVPRRPKWTPGVTTPQELEAMENESFLEWRRGLARREEEVAALAFAANGGGHAGASVTPYEKNLQVWRQLWRVLERSAVVVQIVDARNPLFYLSEDLRRYAMEELGKPMLMLVNKSDYLTERQRGAWSAYFAKRGVDHLFFSAYAEQKKIDAEAAKVKRGESVVSDDESDHYEEVASGDVNSATESGENLGIHMPLTREQLLDALEKFAEKHGCTPDEKYDNRIQYGMVGFPNGKSCLPFLAPCHRVVQLSHLLFSCLEVGKSSVINVLVGSSKSIHGVVRVGVAAQPGKTKHFQTLLLPDRSDMMLCDCPGLVFPSFVSSSADMIAAGVYPIAQMRDHWPVVSLICKRVPRVVLNAHYGIHIPEPSEQELREKGLWTGGKGQVLPPPTAEELLGTYCVARSMLAASSGVPDYQRASRFVVKDYSEGKLLYCHAPPASLSDDSILDNEEYQNETLKTAINKTSNQKKLQKLEQSLEVAAATKSSDDALEEDDDFDDFDSILGDLDEKDNRNNGDKRGKSHKVRG